MGCAWRLLKLALVAALVAALLGVFAYRHVVGFMTSEAVRSSRVVEFEIRPGETARSVLDRLAADGVVDADPRWDLLLRWLRPGACLQAGWHQVEPGATAAELLRAFCARAYARGVELTMPEGTNIFQLADRVAEAGLADRAAFLAAVDNADAARSVGIDAPSLEGYLFPDTYEFAEGATVDDIVRRLVARGKEVRAGVWETPPLPIAAPFSEHALLTIASIVEEEAAVAEERPLIARVIFNRLARGMPLQCDPTCVYGPATYQQRPTRALCRDPASRYSTYVIPALPPTPISNPGRAAIEATLRPADDSEVLFFVAMEDGTGRHAFARTLAEHERNVDRYLRGR